MLYGKRRGPRSDASRARRRAELAAIDRLASQLCDLPELPSNFQQMCHDAGVSQPEVMRKIYQFRPNFPAN